MAKRARTRKQTSTRKPKLTRDDWERHKLRIDDAVRAHEDLGRGNLANFHVVLSSASAALKILTAVNAGALVALLGFAAALAGKEKSMNLPVALLVAPAQMFTLGLLLGILATGGLYFAQFCFAMNARTQTLAWDHPYVRENPTSRRWECAGMALQVAVILSGIATFLFIVLGLLRCLDLIQAIKL